MTDSRTFCSSQVASTEELLETDELYRLLVECAADHAIFMLSPEGVVLSWNRGAEQLTGYSEAEILGEHFSVFYTERDRLEDYPSYELKVAGEEGRFEDEGWRVRKDGRLFWSNVVITAIRNEVGALLGFGKVTRDLTLRRQIEQQREQSEQRYRSLFDNNPDPVFELDLEGRFTQLNTPALHLTGYERDELLGSPFVPLIAQDQVERTTEAFRRVAAGEPQHLETVVVNRDGERRLLSISVVPTFVDGRVAGAFGIAEDITEERRVEQERSALLEREQAARSEAEMAEQRARFLAEASTILVHSLDYQDTLRRVARLSVPRLGDYCLVDVVEEDGSINRIEVCHASPEQEDLLREMQRRYPLDGSRPHPVLDVLRTGRSVFDPEVEDVRLDEIAHDAQHLCGLQELKVRSYMCVPLHARGRTLGALSFAYTQRERRHDESDLEVAEELARRAAVVVDNARLYQAALSANKAKSDFLATMSHELRTPLNAIIGYTELISSTVAGPITGTQERHLRRIEHSSRHLLQLIEEVLSFTRMEAGREEVVVERASLPALVHDTAALMEPLAARKGLDLEVRIPDRAPWLETDTHKVRQILLNLLGNAIKFTNSGKVALEAWVEDDTVGFRVADTGIGIPPDHLDRVFHPFHQVEQEASRRIGGTGLGLSITRHLVQLLGGDISVTSTVGEGTAFTVLLPMRVKPRTSRDTEADG